LRSKANIKGHPLHPILVSFPIVLFIGTFIVDIIFITTNDLFFEQLAKYLEAAGIISALLAAIPGIIDYYFTVPPESSAMKRATKHGLINITMLLIFTFALLIRRDQETSIFLVTGLEATGVILLTTAGWLGGTLVIRNQIGVDHRYAYAGKWSEEFFTDTLNTIELNDLEKLKMNQMKLIHAGQKRIVVGRTETEFVAFEDRCTHRGASLADGVMICGTVQCPWHGSQFKLTSGEVCAGPATEKIKIYKIQSTNNKHYIQLTDDE
jgi:uncharacterized membrane protein/nitrite reductase/ring-hydroxylating ferredoxin subunit